MASTQDLKRRVRSITNTRKLTRAMELVASARLRRAQMRIEAMRPYADRMLELMAGTAQAPRAVRLPLPDRPDGDGQRGAARLARAPGGRARRPADAPGRLLLRARAAADPRAAASRLRRDRALPCAPRVRRLGAGSPDDGDAQRLEV